MDYHSIVHMSKGNIMVSTRPTYRAYSTQTFHKIEQLQKLPPSDKTAIDIVSRVLPFKVNSYVLDNLIDWDNYKDDPIFHLVFPQKAMLSDEHFHRVERLLSSGAPDAVLREEVMRIRYELNPHPSAQLKNIPVVGGEQLRGVQHKYRETVLFFPSHGQTCHAYCTFCFRWPQFVGMNDIKFASSEIDALTSYLRSREDVTDVLFTGGDPLIMRTKILERYIEPLLSDDLSHVKTIRIGTKALGYWPHRFTSDDDAEDLLRLFERIVKSGKNLSIMAHFNHPAELMPDAQREAARAVRATGAQIRTQSPVLRHINNDPSVWATMWREQVNQNMIPYYMFVERDTGPKKYFEVPLIDAWSIFQKAYQQVSGVCRTVRGPVMSAAPGKVQILGEADVAGQRTIAMRFLQGRKPDWVARPFFAEYTSNATWLDQLKPAFGASKFFYEDELSQVLDGSTQDEEFFAFE